MNEENETTTIEVSRKNLEKIKDLKEHQRIPNDEVVTRLLDFYTRYKGVVENAK